MGLRQYVRRLRMVIVHDCSKAISFIQYGFVEAVERKRLIEAKKSLIEITIFP